MAFRHSVAAVGRTRCTNTFSLCPQIKCERAVNHSGACAASCEDPCYSIFWENSCVEDNS